VNQDTNTIARLLDQLSSSTAWQEAVATHAQATNTEPASAPVTLRNDERSSDVSKDDDLNRTMDEEGPAVGPPLGRVGALLELLGSTTTTSRTEEGTVISLVLT